MITIAQSDHQTRTDDLEYFDAKATKRVYELESKRMSDDVQTKVERAAEDLQDTIHEYDGWTNKKNSTDSDQESIDLRLIILPCD